MTATPVAMERLAAAVAEAGAAIAAVGSAYLEMAVSVVEAFDRIELARRGGAGVPVRSTLPGVVDRH